MKKSAFLKLAGSSLILGATMAGCTSTGMGTRSASALEAGQAGQGVDAGKAVTAAEAAVASSPNDGKYRSLLGQAYLSAGRFASAEASFNDALTLGHADARTVIGLAMTQIATGKSEDARVLLGGHMDTVSAADYGLAMALAGDTDEALRVLYAEARQPDATSKVRQNLAYALALAGRWRDSKLVASQDLSPAEAARRMTEWAVLARPGGEMQQVANLMGVTPQADPGMPVRLALGSAEAPVQTAAADTPAPASFVDSAPMAETQVALAPVAPPAAPASVPAMVEAPVFVPASAPAMISVPVPASRQPGRAPASGYIVQLGAFSDADGVNRAWRSISGRYRNVHGFTTLASRAQVKGKVFHRLALSGFDNRMAAEKVCASIKANGSVCFVRNIGGEASRWVSRESMLLASRRS